ncbi:MAG TPA: TRAP transporter substrate-binding protein [Rhodopila sp.]|jgi:TRAP-type C4-dicarboxylate transport system substrate-binding protein|nr:TRAP transporter substrate-binding protein [Rhodopila sp.]
MRHPGTGVIDLLSSLVRIVAGAGLLVGLLACPRATAGDGPIQLKVVGGLDGVSQYTKYEAPFWTQEVPLLTQGRVQAEIHPFDRSGLPGQEMLQLMRLGVVPIGTALLAVVSGDEPELNAVDLPTLNPDMASLRKTVELYRGQLHDTLLEKYGIELLGIYAYPAQVLYCAQSFKNLSDLAGRKVRTSSVGQSEMMSALGAVPIVTPFSEIVNAIRTGVVDCAITGTMSGGEIGLPNVTSYISPLSISWGLSFFGANKLAWDQLPADIREELRTGIHKLELTIWDAADRETAAGLACDIGSAGCVGGRLFHMNLVPITAADEALRKRLLTESILPKWIQRCGSECVTAWNTTLGGALGIQAAGE